DAMGDVTTTAFDTAGNITAITDPLTHTTSFQYDSVNQRTLVTDALSNKTTTTFDPAGNVSTVTNPRTFTTQYAYDAVNRQTATLEAVLQSGTATAGGTTTLTDSSQSWLASA